MTSAAALAPHAPTRRIDVETYHRMGREGLIPPDARVELIDGEIIEMAPIGPLHNDVVDDLSQPEIWIGASVRVRVQGAIRLDLHNEPQPDIAILHRREGNYRRQHPGPDDVLLLIEVADSTLLLDRQRKVPLYARAGIPEVWLVNLVDRRFELYRRPLHGAYPEPVLVDDGTISPLLLPGLKIEVADILR